MKNKINKCINDSFEGYGDFRCSTAVDLLEQLFKEEIRSFSSFLRENYSTEEWNDTWKEWLPIKDDKYRCLETDNKFTIEEIFNKFLKNERN